MGNCIERIWKILLSRNYWNFGLRPSAGILKNTQEHNVSETGSVFLLSPSERDNLSQWTTYVSITTTFLC
jgi:hypothetical protein